MKNKVTSLYVHIPFCEHICPYCDFTKVIYNKNWAKKYIDALFIDLNQYDYDKFKTIYIGGGTPTSLSNDLFEILLSKLSTLLDTNYEFSVETNIDTINIEKLELMKKYGVNRLSIGVQSTLDKNLKLMERKYDFNFIKKQLNIVKQYFDNINLDFIYALPNQNLNDLEIDLDNILSLDVDHLSFYSLTISKSTKFYLKGYKEASDEIQREFYDQILYRLRNAGYKRYEVSNFAKNNKECLHNKVYWRNKHYLAIGVGASGYIDNIRYKNIPNITKYLKNNFEKEIEKLSPQDEKDYYFITNLRLEDGFSIKEFNELYHEDILKNYKPQLDYLINNNLIILNKDNIRASDEGIMLLDKILLKLIGIE